VARVLGMRKTGQEHLCDSVLCCLPPAHDFVRGVVEVASTRLDADAGRWKG
jgi:hypothetical protein